MSVYRFCNIKTAAQCLLAASAVLLLAPTAIAADPVATLVGATGNVTVQRSGASAVQVVSANSELFAGDTLITGADGRASLLLNDESLVQVNRNTRLVLKAVEQSAGWLPSAAKTIAGSVYELLQGELWFRNKNVAVDVEIATPQVAIGVRGTEFVVRVLPASTTEVDMLEGRILASNPFGSIEAITGEQVYAVAGAAPRKRLLLQPENAVQWTALVPPLLTPASLAGANPAAQSVLADFANNQPAVARDKLTAALAAQPDDPLLLTTDAWLKLNSGQPQQAATELAAVTSAHPDAAFAWPVYALALLTTNQPAEALTAIRTAEALAPGNAANYLLESYMHQALFALDAAIKANDQALALEPDNILALVNASRLQFGRGDLPRAGEFAERARAQDSNDAEVLNLSGFLELAQNNTPLAQQNFEQALAADAGFAEAHLGLGLTQMRSGNGAAALESVSTAVALEPTSSIYMSYWGRMLYELDRHERALQVLARAAELDALDPTPHFLQAIVLRDLNRYGESIDAYNRAVELNDNRAVYRSGLLLDQDMATRNIDLSLIFQTFRFNSWAERKAVSAIDDDFGNFAGHIMNAGALSEQVNRDTAFLSETLQARLLQPANRNSFNNFNQYTSFFEEPALEGSVRTSQGSYDIQTYEGEVFGALPEHNLAFQAGFLEGESDGWNGFNGDDISDVSAILKWDATVQDGFLFAYSDFEATLYDDLFRRFEYDDIPNPSYKTESTLERFELGYRHNFGPGNDLLAYVANIQLTSYYEFSARVDRSDDFLIDYIIVDQHQRNDRASSQLQLQWNRRFAVHELIAGTSNYWGDNDVNRNEDVTRWTGFPGGLPPVPNPFPGAEVRLNSTAHRSFNSFYVQDTWFVNDWLQLEGALYYEALDNSEPLVNKSWTTRKLNPRLGAVIRASELDTFRLAAFRYIAPFFSAQLSPTDIAGLTIYRNQQEGAEVDDLELAWERDWGTGFSSVNAFVMKNEVEGYLIPTYLDALGPGKFTDPANMLLVGEGNLHGVEMELNQRLWQRFGLVGRYLYADVEDEWYPDSDRTEHGVILELTFVDPSGFSTGLRQGFRYLNLENRPENDNEHINYTDADIQYQFPGRNWVLRLEGRNLFDNNFNWVTDSFTLGGVIPERNWLAVAEFNF
jgi:tetratricopeptide (TPR) repeat protein